MSARVTKHAGSTHSAHCVGGKVVYVNCMFNIIVRKATKKFPLSGNSWHWACCRHQGQVKRILIILLLLLLNLRFGGLGQWDPPHQHWLGNVNCRTNKIDQEANSADVGHCCHILLCLSSSLQGCPQYHLVAYCSLFCQGFIWFVRRYVAFYLIS